MKKVPERTFLVKAGEGKASGAKKEVWAEVVKNVGAPKVIRTVVLSSSSELAMRRTGVRRNDGKLLCARHVRWGSS